MEKLASPSFRIDLTNLRTDFSLIVKHSSTYSVNPNVGTNVDHKQTHVQGAELLNYVSLQFGSCTPCAYCSANNNF
ncbi:unnamed protein product [Rhizophagus irregularis]|nr:unnamed protein product [Rhizophagus irregularis]